MVRRHFKLGAGAMGDVAGISGTAIADIEKGKTLQPRSDVLANISSKLGVSPAWLLLGEGEMLKSAPTSEEPQKTSSYKEPDLAVTSGKELLLVEAKEFKGPTVVHLQPTVNEEGTPNIGLVNTRVAAGYVQHLSEPEYVRQLPAFSLPDKAFKNGTFRCFVVQGDSMQPTLYAGDWVICRALDNWMRDIRDTFVHVVVTDEQPLVKRVLNRLTERGQLSMLSDNPAYPTQFVDGADVRELWVAVGKISRHFENPRYDMAQELSRTRADVDELLAFMMEMKDQSPATSSHKSTKARK